MLRVALQVATQVNWLFWEDNKMHLHTTELFNHTYCTLQDQILETFLLFGMTVPHPTEPLLLGTFFLSNLCRFWGGQRSLRTSIQLKICGAC